MLSNIWKIMKENKFEVDNEINNDLICGICKCLMIKACSASCGCRFCSDCIENYLDGEEKFCPGAARYCQIQKITYANDIGIDNAINIRIAEIVVKCPRQNCQFTDELQMIENHMRTCDKHPIRCPFNAIGCEANEVMKEEMQDHLNADNYCHSKLLIDIINNLRNEMASMRNEIVELKREKQEKAREIGLLNEEMVAVKDVNRALKGEMETNADLLNAMRQQMERIETASKQQIDELKQNNEQQEENQKLQMEKCANEIRLIETKLDYAKFINFGFLEWRIDNLSQRKSEEYIYSKPFYTGPSGYKMCLAVIIWSDSGIYVCFHLMRGESDDKLAWPFKCAVTIDAVNLADGNICRHSTVKYSDRPDHAGWGKPSSDRNDPVVIYGSNYTDYIAIDSPAAINDLLLLKCKIENL